MELKSHFVPLDKLKIWLWWSRESDVSSGGQALGTHFLPLDQSKMRLGWSRESEVSRIACHFELIFGFLTTQKTTWLSRESDVSKTRMALSTYFRPLDQPKMRLRGSKKRDFSLGCKALRTHFVPLGQPEMRFGWIRKTIIPVVECDWKNFLLLDQPKMWHFLIR